MGSVGLVGLESVEDGGTGLDVEVGVGLGLDVDVDDVGTGFGDGVDDGLIDPERLILPLPESFVDGPDPVLVFKLLPDLRFESALDTPVATFRFGVPGPIWNFAEALNSSLNC